MGEMSKEANGSRAATGRFRLRIEGPIATGRNRSYRHRFKSVNL